MDTMWALSLALVGLPLLLWLLNSYNEWRYCGPLKSKNGAKLPPGHMGWPILGELLDFMWCFKIIRNPEEFVWKRRARYGDSGIYRTHLFGSPSIITCSPGLNKFILGSGTEDGSFTSGWPSELLGRQSVAFAQGHQHKRIRRYLMEAINSPESLKTIFTSVQPIFKAALEDWVSKGRINAHLEAKSMIFGNICTLLASLQPGPLLDTMEKLYRGLTAGLRNLSINVPGTAFHYALKCRKKLSAILLSEIHDRKVNNAGKTDFLQNLMDSVDDDGDMLNEEEILDNILIMLLAGHETTADAITWSLYYLSKYPNVLQKLREETIFIREKKGQDQLLIYDDVKMMSYTSKVAEEVIRLANISPFMFRKVAKDVEFNGHMFPKGWRVLVWVRSNHVDPQYFEDPHKFKPERWDGMKPGPGVYHVFGYGPKFCPGNNLTRLQLMIFLHYLCIDYKWKLINPDVGITFLPHPKPADGAEMTFSCI